MTPNLAELLDGEALVTMTAAALHPVDRARAAGGRYTGATGVAGRLAVRLAKALGAGRVVAAGRDRAALETTGADTTTGLSTVELGAAGPYDLVVDYPWGTATEALLSTVDNPARLVHVGEGADPTVALPAGRLRSSGVGFADPLAAGVLIL